MKPPSPNHELKVLQIVDNLGVGGAEAWLMEVLRLWSHSQQRHPEMDFLITSGKKNVFDDEARSLGAKLFYVPFCRKRLLSFIRRFRRILRDECYDAIHDHAGYLSGWHFLFGIGISPSVKITHIHNAAYQIQNNYGVTLARRITARIGKLCILQFASHILGTSRRVISDHDFDPVPRRLHTTVLHCGIQPERFLGDPTAAKRRICAEFNWPADSKIILFAGRIDRSPDSQDSQTNKNAPLAVKIGIECAKMDSRIRMLLAGALSSAVPILQERIKDAACNTKIMFCGVRRDIEHLMLGSDVLLFPSRGEGLGMVAIEAQASGLPVVASTEVPRECVVIPELVDFISLNEPDAIWAQRVMQRLSANRPDPSSYNALVAASDFAIKNSAKRLFDLYRSRNLVCPAFPPHLEP